MPASSEQLDVYHKWLGIPPAEQPPTLYRLLGLRLLEKDAEVIANAADRCMAHVRTFQNGPNAAVSQKLLNELAAARLSLLTHEKKQQYDAKLTKRIRANAAAKKRKSEAAKAPVMPKQPPIAQTATAPAEILTGIPTHRPTRFSSAYRQKRKKHLLNATIFFLITVLSALGLVALSMLSDRSSNDSKTTNSPSQESNKNNNSTNIKAPTQEHPKNATKNNSELEARAEKEINVLLRRARATLRKKEYAKAFEFLDRAKELAVNESQQKAIKNHRRRVNKTILAEENEENEEE